MPAGRFDFIGEAARFAPSAGSVTVRFIGVEPGLAFVATRASGSALLHVDACEVRDSLSSVPRIASSSPCRGQRTHRAELRRRLGVRLCRDFGLQPELCRANHTF